MSQPPSAPPSTLKPSQKPTWLQRRLPTVLGIALGIGGSFAYLLRPESMGSISTGEWVAVLAGAFFLAILCHECGHLIAGWLVRFEIISFAIGPFGVQRKPEGWKFIFNKQLNTALGFVGVQPRSYERIHRRLSIFIIGGPLGNLVAAGVCGLLLMVAQDPLSIHFYLVMVNLSLLCGLANCIPYKNHSIQSDGARLLMLYQLPQEAERWIAVIALNGALQRGERPRDWDTDAITRAIASPDHSVDHYVGMLMAYLWAEDHDNYDQSQAYLEHMLTNYPHASPHHQAIILAEGAFFYSYRRHNLDLARDCWNRLKPLGQHIPHHFLVHTRTTLLAAEGRLDEARERLKEYMQVRKEHPYAWMREGEAKWLESMQSAINGVEAPASA